MAIIRLLTTPGGNMLIFFDVLGFGYTAHSDALESSFTLSFKLWKMNTFLTFSIA